MGPLWIEGATMRWGVVVIALAISGCASEATALTVLASCGPSKGQSYYFEGGFVGPGQGGWRSDGMDGGRITIILKDDNSVDILMKDATGFRSYNKDGINLTVISVDAKNRVFLIKASQTNLVETYMVKTNEVGVGTLAWTSASVTQAFTKTRIMTASCGPEYEITP